LVGGRDWPAEPWTVTVRLHWRSSGGTLPSWRREFPAKTPAKCWGNSVLLVMNSLDRVAEINAIAGALNGKVENVDAIAAWAIAENWSV